MQQHVIPLIRTDRHVITDYQDNARPHDACDVMDFLEQKNVNVLPWPAVARSAIDDVRDEMERRFTIFAKSTCKVGRNGPSIYSGTGKSFYKHRLSL